MVETRESPQARQLDRVFHALADPTRRSILRRVAGQELTVSQIAKPFNMSLAAVSKHLKVLEGVGLIAREKRGSFQYVQTNVQPMKQAHRWLGHFEEFWNEHLDRLETAFREGSEP